MSVLSMVAVLALSGVAPRPEGAWRGDVTVPGGSMSIVLHIAKDPDSGALTAILDSPDQGAFGLAVPEIAVDGATLTFAMPGIRAAFRGDFRDEDSIEGTWMQAGSSAPLTFQRADPAELPKRPEVPEALAGNWAGTLTIGKVALRLVLRIEREGDGPLRAVLDSPDQGIKGMPVTSLALEGKDLTFGVKSVGGTFRGHREADDGPFVGEWQQGLVKLPLTLEKKATIEEPRRPQTPKPPFPYDAEEVTFRNAEAGVTLAGTLTVPRGAGPFPAAVLLSGSGPQDRDETLMGHRPFLVLADALTRRGIAVLRYDDRGVGGSSGDTMSATSPDFAGDALAAVAFLKTRPRIAPDRIGLIGHSEGGVVAPIAAARNPDDVAFLVLLAGAGDNGAEILVQQLDRAARQAGADEETLRAQEATLRKMFAAVQDDESRETLDAKLRTLARELGVSGRADEPGVDTEDSAGIAGLLRLLEAPWTRYFLTLDPREALRRVRCPVLALCGSLDAQVAARANLGAIEAALNEAGNPDITVEELPGLNHLFQEAETGDPTEYARIEQTFAPRALDTIADWILKRFGPAR